MSLTLEIVSGNRRALGAKASKTFGPDGGTIGRALESDWALPDDNRYLSGRHASIDFHAGSYYLVDTSRNGVFVNGATEPVGGGRPQRLFSGDTIRIGDYEMRVTIEEFDDADDLLPGMTHEDPVDRRQRVESPDPTSYDLIDAHVMTGVGIEIELEEEDDADEFDFAFDLESGPVLQAVIDPDAGATDATAATAGAAARLTAGADRAANPDAAPGPDAAAEADAAAGPDAPAAPDAAAASAAPQAAPPATATTTPGVTSIVERRAVPVGPLDAFFKGAGIDAPKLNPQQAARLMKRLGQLTRELVAGTIDCLHLRAIQKAQLKQADTVIQRPENNPLKFSANVHEGLTRLLLDESDESMNPVESVRSAFADLTAHERALLVGMREALDEYLDRLQPEAIEHGRTGGRMGALMNAANRHRYWETYKEVYAGLVERPVDEFPRAFLDELARAYERETARAESAADDSSNLLAG